MRQSVLRASVVLLGTIATAWIAAPQSAAAAPARFVALMSQLEAGLPCGDMGGHNMCGTDDHIVTFSSNSTKSREIAHRLTLDESNRYTEPSWGPLGRRIAFMNGPRVAVMDANGKHRHSIGPCCFGSVAWSHNKNWLFASGSRSISSLSGIYKLRTDGRKLRRLTTGGSDAEPAESIDGAIAFVRTRTPSHFWIYLRTRHGRVRPLTPGWDPAWSPDGKRIVYIRGGSIFTITPNGRHRHRLTRDRGNSAPAWSPGGGWIAFVRGGSSRIVEMTPDGSRRRKIGPKARRGYVWRSPSWRP